MLTEKLNEIYRGINSNSPYNKMEKIKESDLYKLWEQSVPADSPESVPLTERILHFLRHPRVEQILILAAVLLIVTGIVLLILAGKQEKKDGTPRDRPSEKISGVLTNILLRQDGKKKRPYGIVEFDYNGFQYSRGFFFSPSEKYKTGDKIPVFVNPDNPGKSQIGVEFHVESSPVRSAGQWLVVIGIAVLLCVVL